MENHEDNDDPIFGVTLPRFSAGDMFKFAAAVVFIAMAWARMESGLSQIEGRLDKMDSIYVRRDVNEQELKSINDNLLQLRIQLERVEMKLEK